jgi:hypothetical protein
MEEKDFMAGEHMFARVVPQLVIHDAAATDIVEERDGRKHDRHNEE